MAISGKLFRILVLLLGALAAGPVFAQATRTWISGVGDDANPCSRTAPCKTFAGAISKTAAAGVIDILDPGGFGALTITKSITLENVGEIGGVLISGTNGIVIIAPGAIVSLRGLSFEGLGTGANSVAGVSFVQGSALIVERCDIGNFYSSTGLGISFTPNSAATLTVRDSTIHGNGNGSIGGILIAPTSGGSANAVLDNVRILGSSGDGLQVQGPASVAVSNSIISLGSGNGIDVSSASATASVMLDHVAVSNNSSAGILAQGAASLIRFSDSTLTANTYGIRALSGGTVTSFGNNRNIGNTINGAPTATSPLQ